MDNEDVEQQLHNEEPQIDCLLQIEYTICNNSVIDMNT